MTLRTGFTFRFTSSQREPGDNKGREGQRLHIYSMQILNESCIFYFLFYNLALFGFFFPSRLGERKSVRAQLETIMSAMYTLATSEINPNVKWLQVLFIYYLLNNYFSIYFT